MNETESKNGQNFVLGKVQVRLTSDTLLLQYIRENFKNPIRRNS